MAGSVIRVGPPSQPLSFHVEEVDEGASWAMVSVTMESDPPVTRAGEGTTKVDATWDAIEGLVPHLATDPRFLKEVKKQLSTLFLPSYG